MKPPFDREHVTAASRIMLPFDVFIDLTLGLIWALQTDDRTSSAINAVRRVGVSTSSVGWVLMCVALIIAYGMVKKNRYVACLGLGSAAAGYGVITILSLNSSTHLSLAAPLWPLYLMVAHIASLVSVTLGEADWSRK